ncbi:unnamed protein product [Prorocentrum cordatum]|uniref:Metalloendopeptidase n=1 Tax=Prorocentrum cordatum TaxID=2364126 RepID=A0ABN9VZX0_9DINO|nr:unnamed protein product [Polarella glacialis]
MPRASVLIFASLGAASAADVAPACARDSALLQARATVTNSPHEGHVRVERQMVGCFPRAAGDMDDQQSFQDTTCVSAARRNSSLQPCRSGMPFFRLPMQKQQSSSDCFMFCLSKGLDLSGLVHSERAGLSECRCGATRANRAAWYELTPPPGLLLPNGSVDPDDNEHCKMLVWQYTGPLEDGAVPTVLTELSTGDEAYIDGIAVGVDPHEITEEDGAGEGTPTVHPDTLANLSLLGVKGLCEDHTQTGVGNNMPCSQAKTWCNAAGDLGLAVRGACPFSCGLCTQAYGWMPCYPHPCSPGGGPWTTKVGNVVNINYYFDNLDADRQAAFNKAKDEWESKTCVRFTYSSATPRMRITVTNQATCSAFVGFPGSDGTLDVNLGWCNSLTHWGNIAHELGHALGMNHEQNRPDGPGQTNTPAGWKGPHLRVKWQNIDTVWRPQWEGQKRSYYGSQTAGYSAYDYGSIMHYGLGDNADATNSAWQSVPGQRDGLSAGDIAQFQDMYQCGDSAPQPTPAPAPTPPPPTPGPAPAGCVDSTENPWGQSCAAWLAQGACAESDGIRQHCKGELPAVQSSADPRSGGRCWLHRQAGAVVVWVYLPPVGVSEPLRWVADDSGGLSWELRRGRKGHLRVHVRGVAWVGALRQLGDAEGRVPPHLRAVPVDPAEGMTSLTEPSAVHAPPSGPRAQRRRLHRHAGAADLRLSEHSYSARCEGLSRLSRGLHPKAGGIEPQEATLHKRCPSLLASPNS